MTSAASLHPLVEDLAACIRRRWQGLPSLEPLPVEPGLAAIHAELEGEALFIRNELFRCRGLRKLHLETARLGSGLQILHCVFFPDPCFDLPVFGADIVATRAGVSAAIVDLSPVGKTLPPAVEQGLKGLPSLSFTGARELPGWGSIFSDHVCFVRPASAVEEQLFLQRVDGVLAVLVNALALAQPQGREDPATVERWQAQVRYCRQQKRNDKTRRVLEKAFDPQWADRYIEELLFDEPAPP